jgi:hypothetical protein
MGHVHIGLAEFFVTVLNLLIALFLLRLIAIRSSNTAFGKALATIVF